MTFLTILSAFFMISWIYDSCTRTSHDYSDSSSEYLAPVDSVAVGAELEERIEYVDSAELLEKYGTFDPVLPSTGGGSSSSASSDAYSEGFDAGYNNGHYDAIHDYGQGYSYNSSNRYEGGDASRYVSGYKAGYFDGYYSGELQREDLIEDGEDPEDY